MSATITPPVLELRNVAKTYRVKQGLFRQAKAADGASTMCR